MVGNRSPEGRCTWQHYWTNAVDVGAPATDALGEAARQAKAYLAVGVIERDTQFSGGTLYDTLHYFGPNGRLLDQHRKLKISMLCSTNYKTSEWSMTSNEVFLFGQPGILSKINTG